MWITDAGRLLYHNVAKVMYLLATRTQRRRRFVTSPNFEVERWAWAFGKDWGFAACQRDCGYFGTEGVFVDVGGGGGLGRFDPKPEVDKSSPMP